jgi:hypothetical protein
MHRTAVACLAAAAALSSFDAAGAPPVSARLAQARYVALGYDLGDGVLLDSASVGSDRVLPEEREAVRALHDALEAWGHYSVVVRSGQADLVVAVRKGRLVAAGGGLGLDAPGLGRASRAGIQVSSPYDMLTVYDGTTVLWRRTRPPGSPSSFASMFSDFRTDVEKTAKKP